MFLSLNNQGLIAYHRKLQGSHWCGALVVTRDFGPAVLRGGDNPPGWISSVLLRATDPRFTHPLFSDCRRPTVLFAEYNGVGGSAHRCDPLLEGYLREHFSVSKLVELDRKRGANLPWLSSRGTEWAVEAARYLVDYAAWLEQN